MKYNLIVADPCWSFGDSLTMSKTKRGAVANYKTLTIEQIKNIPIQDITEDDALLCLWVVGSQLQSGLDVMKAWGFEQKQTWVWVKSKQEHSIKQLLKCKIKEFSLNDILNFKMGRLMRQTHELCLIGTKGNIYGDLKNKSQRSVDISMALKHSAKPETLQDRLEIMFPDFKKLEMFGRRSRAGWTVIGLESPDYFDIDINAAIDILKKQGGTNGK